jgi:hypothetical protein
MHIFAMQHRSRRFLVLPLQQLTLVSDGEDVRLVAQSGSLTSVLPTYMSKLVE